MNTYKLYYGRKNLFYFILQLISYCLLLIKNLYLIE